MASAASEQLRLQHEQFAQTTEELLRSRSPKFVVSYLGVDDRVGAQSFWEHREGNERPLKHKLAFANVGGTACEVVLSIGYGSLEPDEGPIVIWPQFETKLRIMELFASDTHGDVIRLEINYKDADGVEGTDELSFVRLTHGKNPTFDIL